MRWAFLPLLGLLTGCYIVNQAVGQIDILLYREDVEDVIASQRLSPEHEVRLRMVGDIKDYAERVVGLTFTDNYTTYYQVRETHISYIVSACEKDSFRPYIWWFPVVGELPYKGFFDLEDARVEAADLRAQGYDVTVRPVGAYSTLGWFSDPVFSTMLRMSGEDLANLVIHELVHSTVYVTGRADFNENLASFVGTTASLQYMRNRYGTESVYYRRAIAKIADRAMFSKFMDRFFQRLDKLYKSDASREDKLKLREEILKHAKREYGTLRKKMNTGRYDYFTSLEMNNAEILAERLYSNDEPFQKIYDEEGSDWHRFWVRIRKTLKEGPRSSR